MKLDFLPKQKEFLEAVEPEVLFSGAYGSGKTLSICSKVLLLSLRYPKNRIYFCRKLLSDFMKTTYRTLLMGDGEVEPIIPKEYIKSHNKTDRSIILVNDSEILYGDVNVEKIKSLNLGGVGVDEMGELDDEEVSSLTGRLRLSGIAVRQLFGATNPYSENHHLYNRFVVNPRTDSNGNPMTHFIESSMFDNIYLPESYIENQKSTLFGHYYDRYVLGKWVGADKLVFDNFDRKIHIIKRFELPKEWKRFRAVDFGYRSPFTCGWFVRVGEDSKEYNIQRGDLILYREMYYTERTSSINAQRVKELSNYPDGTPEKIEWTVCDWDAGDRADLEAVGIRTIKANKTDKMSRLQKVRQRLGNNDINKGLITKPTFFIFEDSLAERDRKIRFDLGTGRTNNNPTCAAEEFMAYSWKQSKNNTITEEPEDKYDHAMDMIGYLIEKYDNFGAWKDIEFKYI